jgi:hypothetical protein
LGKGKAKLLTPRLCGHSLSLLAYAKRGGKGFTAPSPNLQRAYSKHYYTTSSCLKVSKEETLNPWFVTGFTDAEGSFNVSVAKHASYTLGSAELEFKPDLE